MEGSSPRPQRRGAAGGAGTAGEAGAGGVIGGLGSPGASSFLFALHPILVYVSKKHPICLLWVVWGVISAF